MMETYWVSDRVPTAKIAGLSEEELAKETERRRSGRSVLTPSTLTTPRASFMYAVKNQQRPSIHEEVVADTLGKPQEVVSGGLSVGNHLAPAMIEFGGDSTFSLQTVVTEDGTVKINVGDEVSSAVV